MSDYVERELPRYICHKIVHALKLQSVDVHANGGATITPANKEFAPFLVERGVLHNYCYFPGGYYFVCVDGYKALFPAQAFEADYNRI